MHRLLLLEWLGHTADSPQLAKTVRFLQLPGHHRINNEEPTTFFFHALTPIPEIIFHISDIDSPSRECPHRLQDARCATNPDPHATPMPAPKTPAIARHRASMAKTNGCLNRQDLAFSYGTKNALIRNHYRTAAPIITPIFASPPPKLGHVPYANVSCTSRCGRSVRCNNFV